MMGGGKCVRAMRPTAPGAGCLSWRIQMQVESGLLLGSLAFVSRIHMDRSPRP